MGHKISNDTKSHAELKSQQVFPKSYQEETEERETMKLKKAPLREGPNEARQLGSPSCLKKKKNTN